MTDADKYFWEQDEFRSKMIEAYKQHKIPQWFAFEQYFEWKIGNRGCDFTRSEITSMRNTISRLLDRYDKLYPDAWENINPENPYSGYGEDWEVIRYLTFISEELVNFLILRVH